MIKILEIIASYMIRGLIGYDDNDIKDFNNILIRKYYQRQSALELGLIVEEIFSSLEKEDK